MKALKKSKKSTWSKTFFQYSRDLHVYFSTLLFSLLIFFSITGILLNHLDWLPSKSSYNAIEYSLDEKFNGMSGDSIDVNALEVYLMSRHGLPKARSIDLDREINEVSFDFPLPAGSSFIVVDMALKSVVVEAEKSHWLLLMNDLHKGRHTGSAWSWLIDLSAGFMVYFSITGMIILFQQRRRKKAGLVLAVLGTVSPVLLYWLAVPYFVS